MCVVRELISMLADDNDFVFHQRPAAKCSAHANHGAATRRHPLFFNRALRPGVDLQRAFNGARITISEWELAENLVPSNPQGHFGPALVEKLAPVFAAKSSAGRP